MDLGTSVQAQKFEVEDTAEPDSKSESGDWVQGTDNGQIYYYNTTTGGQFLLVLLHTVLPKQVKSCEIYYMTRIVIDF